MSETVEVFAPAKINLTLHVTGRRNDGYHLLDSLVVFADVGDRLWLTEGDTLSLNVVGPFAEGVPTDDRNLVWKAAKLAGWTGQIRLEKNLPHGGGIGGGSADAGALLRALGIKDGALSLGADVPVCRLGRAARMSGIGERVEPLEEVPSFHAVLVNPGVHLATPSVFQRLVTKTNAPMKGVPAAGADRITWNDWLRTQRNDLQNPAREMASEIGEVLDALSSSAGVLLSRMSGSGSTCFGLFPSRAEAESAASNIFASHPDWWCVATELS